MSKKQKKLVITILQYKRVAAPYFFINYVFPKWKAILKENVELVLIQHKPEKTYNQRRESEKLPSNRVDLVEQWTNQGKFYPAEIVRLSKTYPKYSNIPGTHQMVVESLKRGGELHLWLEDDAIVFDPHPENWDEMLGGKEVGVWGKYAHLNVAHLLTRQSFDENIVNGLSNYQKWNNRNPFTLNIEPWLRSQKKTSRAYLPQAYCVRAHIRNYPNCGIRYLAEAVRKIAPEEADILDIDFGKGASKLKPFTIEETRKQARKMNRRHPLDWFFAFYNKYFKQLIEKNYIK